MNGPSQVFEGFLLHKLGLVQWPALHNWTIVNTEGDYQGEGRKAEDKSSR